MGRFHKFAACLSAAAMTLVLPVQANAATGAEKVRRLDIMLMVTGLRCRNTPDNFQPDFQRFEASHLTELNQAARTMKSDLAVRYGNAGAARALDRLSVGMANEYGQGHPWLNCAQLKTVARNLAQARGGAVLEAAADQLLADSGSPQLAMVQQ
ncbi:MAG: S-adenosyl-L-homocysteine hydrolase [Sphingomonadales bacterium]|nr:S-adenosyl-L-homocysteine hydrolase [Sphingomonadales bacterium]MDE2568093.1 S-adenosyl-L-homocysteine hydrolase [Sphingomonadales bacterium]